MSTPDIQESPLIQALERILCCMQVKVPSVTQSLQPGLTREQIEVQLQRLPFRLPEEVYQLYQWRDGSVTGTEVKFLPQYRILSLEEAIAEWQFIYDLECEIYEGLIGDPRQKLIDFNKFHWLPLFAEDGNYYVISGDIEFKTMAPILYRFYTDFELSLEFNSLTDMMLAIAECFETGAYYFDSYSYLEFNEVQEAQIWLKYKPQRAANIIAMINNQSQHLSDQELQRAYSDLVNTQHPQALSVLIQAVEELEPEIRSLRFQVNHAYASTRFGKADVMEALGQKEPKFEQLLRYIGQIDSSEAIQYLWDLTERNNANVGDYLIKLLSYRIDENIKQTRDTQAMRQSLFQILQQSCRWNLNILRLLGILRDPRAVELLLTLLWQVTSGSYSVNEQVLAEPEIPVQINSESTAWSQLLAVIETLELVGDSRALDSLLHVAQQQRDPTIRLVAGRALKALGDPRAEEIFAQLIQEGSCTPDHLKQMRIIP
jgi:cell wall assembly regulator SMI1